MKKWLVQLKFELSFLFKNWLLLPLPMLFFVWLVTSMTVERVSGSENLYISVYRATHSTIFILVIGLSILIGVYLMRRDIGNDSFEWHQAFPVSNFVFLSAKFVAGMIYMSLFTLLMGSVFGTLSSLEGIPPIEIINVLKFFIAQYEVSLLISLSLGIILSVIIQNRFVYLIAFCAWIFGTIFMEIFILDQTELFYLKTFHLTYLFIDSILVNGSWGIELMREEIKLQRLFVLSFSLMLLVTTMLVLNSRRPNEHYRLWKLLGTLSVLGAIIAYIPYGSFWSDRLSQFNNAKDGAPVFSHPSEGDTEVYLSFPPNHHPEALPEEERTIYKQDRFAIDQYEIEINQEEGNSLNVTADVTIPKNQLVKIEKLKFTLNNSFSIKEVKVDQLPISYEQEGNFITLTLPDTVNEPTIHLTYEGVYNLWTQRIGQEYYPGFFLNDQLVMPAHTAWYPLPGHQYLIDSTGTSRTDIGLTQPTEFKVTLDGVQNKVYGSIENSQSSGETHKLSGKTARLDLFSGNLTEIESAHYNTTLITVPYRHNEAKNFMKEMDKRLVYFEEFLNEDIDPVHHYFFLPLDQMRWSGYFNQEGFIDQNYLISPSYNYHQHNFINELVEVNLFHEDNYVNDRTLTETIKAAFNYLYELENDSEQDPLTIRSKYAHIPDDAAKQNYSNEYVKADKVLDMIQNAMSQGREAKVKEVLSNIYSKHWSNNSYPTGYDLYQEPAAIIRFEEWKKEWNDVMENEID